MNGDLALLGRQVGGGPAALPGQSHHTPELLAWYFGIAMVIASWSIQRKRR
jgi:hypothetical protein